ncbi:type II toxin-antitoxin system Phd/YefM family antitoxin [Halanaerobacter jeridensis]|uniref:Antitoxin n=1 Tax=Halanaerobacter jeridensis TaxID=706427 RepID=A0A938XUG8_9FIRM|nr:type II toxin-antitoxin system Phd/YefM family antitoxin [Halanaerobacter jeridensis]MBM7556541.1 PHD/YefM family antitoxin component YafN of YafNO toxin-antitoxin module [Halanaerobacter jeridensis]
MAMLEIDRDNMVSSSEVVRNFSKMLDKSKENPLFIMRNNDIEGIMMDIEEYEMLLEKIEYLENLLEDEYIEDGIKDRKKEFDLDDAIEEEEIMEMLDK